MSLRLKRGVLLKQRSNVPGIEKQLRAHLLGDHHRFDEQTGQVYSEFTASIQSRDDRGWTRQAESVATRGTGLLGARTLQDVAFDCILENIADVTYEGIECLPDLLVLRLWHSVNTRCLLSFDTWLMFSKFLSAGPNATLNTLRFRKNIETPLSPLATYIDPLTSPNFDFITSLSLTKTYDLPDLIRLSSITNLGVLEIINTPKHSPSSVTAVASPVNDRVIRAWHHAAKNEGAFRVLRILKFWNCGDVTAKSLSYLPAFPILALFDVQGCGFNLSSCSETKALGWKAIVEPDILAVLESACVQRAQQLRPDSPVRRLGARQPQDDSPTLKIPRSEVPSFLTRPEAAATGQPQPPKGSSKVLQNEVNRAVDDSLKGKARQKARKKVFQKSPLYEADETWELNNYATFSKLGELRSDTDLAATGLDVAEYVVFSGSEVICPIPIVSLRLGLNIEDVSSNSRRAKVIDALAFLRLEVPTAVVDKNSKHAHSSGDESNAAAVLSNAKKRKTQVKETKKQSMMDLLNSFY